jgi:hypothetical protein
MRADDKRKQYLENLLEGPTKDSIQVVDPVFSVPSAARSSPEPPHPRIQMLNAERDTTRLELWTQVVSTRPPPRSMVGNAHSKQAVDAHVTCASLSLQRGPARERSFACSCDTRKRESSICSCTAHRLKAPPWVIMSGIETYIHVPAQRFHRRDESPSVKATTH